MLNNVLLSCGCATVFLGTLYPLFLDAMGGPKLSVGFPFFNRTFVPMMVPMVMALGVGPLLAWKRGDLLGALQRLWVAFIATGLVLLVAFYVTQGGPVLAVLGLGLAAWLAMAVLTELAERLRLFRVPLGDSARRAIHLPRAAYGMSLAHLGLAVSVAGFSASAWDQEAIEIVQVGGAVHARRLRAATGQRRPCAGRKFHRRRGVRPRDARRHADRRSCIRRGGSSRCRSRPPARRRSAPTSCPISTSRLGESDSAGNWTLRVYWKPLVPWIWIGCVIMAFGGMVSLSDRRWRVGVAERARTAPGAVPAAGE